MQSVIEIQQIADYFSQHRAVYYFKDIPPGKDLRVFIYIRVSTKMQEHRFSLKGQIQELIAYAKSMGWGIVGVYRDVDSGGKLDKAGLTQLLDDVDEDKGDIVLCIDQDRVSRLDTVSWEYLKSQLRENCVKIAEPGKITDLADEDDEFFADLKNLFARREKKKIVKRMMRGKRQRTREGKGWGKPLWEYLYDKKDGSYSLDEKWSWIIPLIDDLYCVEGLSDSDIAIRLSAITKTPSGKEWNAEHISRRLKSKAYHGVLEKHFASGETITTEDIYPKLRSEETWHKIQALRKEKYRRRAPVFPHILRNIETTCGNCGRVLSLKQSGDSAYSIHYYFQHGREYRPTYSPDCGMSINSIRIEFNFIAALKDILSSEDTAKRYIQFEHGQADIDQLTSDINSTTKLLQATQQKIDMLLDLYLDGGYSKDVLNAKKEVLENERSIHQSKKRQLEAKKEALSANQFNYSTVYQYLAVAERFNVLLTAQEQMEMVGTLFASGVLYEDRFVLQGNMAGIPVEVIIPVADDPFAYRNQPGKRKPKRVTKASLGMEILKKDKKEHIE
ncbi:recombinase family protein [Paenibacillus sp. L3-i20]|uniref:recombinase family protein n=1 Tax=Paenibacillus sp. L3-i20 TaxID=2905833 RepID=UPI001EDEB61A|nr:recombinase family protein [Paenibacillus sp. L3-i20]GKU79343.1 integrase [Paenibacillus sp. L3-i20]